MTPQLSQLAAEWRAARLLHPIYVALAREFVIEVPSCGDLEAGAEAPPQESVEQARHWFAKMDEGIQIHQLRQFLQTSSLATQDILQGLLSHYLGKAKKSASDRDKVDFLLVQFFSHCAPSGLEDSDVDLEYVAQVLEPVLGAVELSVPAWLKPLEPIVQSARSCRSLNQLLHSGVLEQGRKIKSQCGDNYYVPAAMVAFTRFSFLMRRTFFRLMHEDLNAILDGLRELEHRGATTLDCRRAQFSVDEPIARLRMICQSWRVMFQAEYSSGQPLRMLVDMRAAVDDALGHAPGKSANSKATVGKPAARAQAAAAQFSSSTSSAPEFEVSAAPEEWGAEDASSPGNNRKH